MSAQKLWVQHQTTATTYGPTKISVDGITDVDDFLKEVKKEFEIPGPASQLSLYQPDGTTDIDVGDSPADYLDGNSRATPLIVKTNVVSDLQHTSIPDKLQQLEVQFSIRDINYLMDNDTAKYSLLKSPQLTKGEVQKLLNFAKSKIKSATQRTIGKQHSFFLDGCLNVGQGQVKSSLYYAF
jgi:hypothetical protein